MIRRFLGFIDRNAPSWDSFLLIHLSSADFQLAFICYMHFLDNKRKRPLHTSYNSSLHIPGLVFACS